MSELGNNSPRRLRALPYSFRDFARTFCARRALRVLSPHGEKRQKCFPMKNGSFFKKAKEVFFETFPPLAAARREKKPSGASLWAWMKFLSARNKEDLNMLAKKNPQVGKAVVRLMELSNDERTRLLYESQQKMEWDNLARERAARSEGLNEGRKEGLSEGRKEGLSEGRKEGLSEGRKEGLSEGRKEGLSEGRKEIAKKALSKGSPVEFIQEITGLDAETIHSLKE
jgi:flagellar biosynthesis/type III secretory pathway protein FliH